MVSYDQFASKLLTKYQMPGCAIAVARNGKLVFARGYGIANKATGELVQPDSRFRIASLSKPITAAAVLLLVQRGKLTLDQRVFDILSYQPLPGESVDPRLATITVRNLLEHSGGWNRDTTFDPMFLPVAIAAAAGKPAPAGTDSIIRYMMGKPLQFDPGSSHNYSNFGYMLLGRVIERISGQPYEQFVREQVLAPSGAACMFLGHSLQTQPLPKEVRYYDYPGAPLVPSIDGTGTKVPRPDGGFNLEAMDAHGGWVASTVDYLRFVLSVDARNDPGDILAAPTIDTMIARPAIPFWAGSAAWYAKGWNVRPVQGRRQLVAPGRPERHGDDRGPQLRRRHVGCFLQLAAIKRRLPRRARLRNVDGSGRRHELALGRPVPILRPLLHERARARGAPLMPFPEGNGFTRRRGA
jgi:N-acyl-D-amino-acid deacylase